MYEDEWTPEEAEAVTEALYEGWGWDDPLAHEEEDED
jgi:hypothetical protein